MVAVIQIADLYAEAGLIEDGFGRGDVEAGHVVYWEGRERLRAVTSRCRSAVWFRIFSPGCIL